MRTAIRPRSALSFLLPAASLLAAACSAPSGSRPAQDANARLQPSAETGATSAKRTLTLDDIFDPLKKLEFGGASAGGRTWIDDEHYVEENDLLEARTGKRATWIDTAKLEAAVRAIPGIPAEAVKPASKPNLSTMSADRKAQLSSVQGDLWILRFDSDHAVRVTNTPSASEKEASFSPNGQRIAFVRDNDLYSVELATGIETRLTSDGSATLLNGVLDWLYQEEVYGRGVFRGYWWSPDSTRLAFLKLDEQGVPTYTLVDDIPTKIAVETSPYPRAGEPNPKVSLHVARADGAGTAVVGLLAEEKDEPLVVDVSWSPKSELHYSVQDREQRWLQLCRAQADGSEPTLLIRETTQAWVDNHGSPTWLADGTYLWFSERDGWKHLYHYDSSKLLSQITSGAWEARTLHGVDAKNGWIYLSGTKDQPIGGDAYRVKLDGGGLQRLTQRAGTHSVTFNPGFSSFLDAWSDVATPTQVRLHASDGTELRVVDAKPVAALASVSYSKPELLQVPTRDGFAMEAMLVKPAHFDAGKRYPVMMFLYAGPHAPTVKNAWGGVNGMFQQLLASRGVVVWSCDNQSASGKGALSAWAAYQQLGVSECADIQDGIAWLKRQPWVDADRIGVTGWSYGGFMTSYLLTHTQDFALGVAGGSVTDWHDYDSIYTERCMLTPQNNPAGYAKTSVQAAAANLSGHLVLVHGALDDNVHPGNTLKLAHALQKAGKPFDLMLYPQTRHAVSDPLLVKHWRALQLEQTCEHLLGMQGVRN